MHATHLQVATFADDRHVVFLGLSPREARIPLPPLGTLRLDPVAMVVASMPSRNRAPRPWVLPVPDDTSLVGLVAHLQGLDVDPGTRALFTRLLRVRVTRSAAPAGRPEGAVSSVSRTRFSP